MDGSNGNVSMDITNIGFSDFTGEVAVPDHYSFLVSDLDKAIDLFTSDEGFGWYECKDLAVEGLGWSARSVTLDADAYSIVQLTQNQNFPDEPIIGTRIAIKVSNPTKAMKWLMQWATQRNVKLVWESLGANEKIFVSFPGFLAFELVFTM